MLTEHAETADARAYTRAAPRLDARDLAAVEAALREAERPLLLVGGPDWDDAACADIVAFAEANGLPAACSFRRQDIFDNNSPAFVGDLGTSAAPSLVRSLQEVDLLLVVGARLGEITTQGYESLEAPVPRQRLVHVHASAEELGRVYAPDVAIVSEARAFARAVKDARWLPPGRWEGWRKRLRAAYEDAATPAAHNGRGVDGGLVMAQLQAALPPGAIVTLDAGNHTGWPQRFFRYARPGRQIGSTSGAMGYSVPAAVAASLVTDKVVIGCVGDGGFMMSGQEIATAVQHGGKPIILLFNNNMYGTIRMHQEREHPERVIGTDLVNPDFVALGKAHGIHAERVVETVEFLPALERALGSGRAALLELVMDPEQVSTRATITGLRQRRRPAETAEAGG
jgi:acetolactate synthase-1/2/3 large subunit